MQNGILVQNSINNFWPDEYVFLVDDAKASPSSVCHRWSRVEPPASEAGFLEQPGNLKPHLGQDCEMSEN